MLTEPRCSSTLYAAIQILLLQNIPCCYAAIQRLCKTSHAATLLYEDYAAPQRNDYAVSQCKGHVVTQHSMLIRCFACCSTKFYADMPHSMHHSLQLPMACLYAQGSLRNQGDDVYLTSHHQTDYLLVFQPLPCTTVADCMTDPYEETIPTTSDPTTCLIPFPSKKLTRCHADLEMLHLPIEVATCKYYPCHLVHFYKFCSISSKLVLRYDLIRVKSDIHTLRSTFDVCFFFKNFFIMQ